MAFEWPVDKLSLINRALRACGDNQVNAADDGSEEWDCASAAYETWLAYIIEGHPWAWGKTVVTLPPAANVPNDPMWDTAYNLPADLVHLIWVRVDDRPSVYQLVMGPTTSGPTPQQLYVNAQGGPPRPVPPQTPAPLTIQYISSITSDVTFATPTLVLALEGFVISGIFSGLHKDYAQHKEAMLAARSYLADAQTRHDQQMPKRALYNSRMTAARRVRRPWPPVPGGWGGTGIPGAVMLYVALRAVMAAFGGA
jgi:hypothetical protein